MDATKETASSPLGHKEPTPDVELGRELQEQIKATYKGVPDTIEPESLVGKF